MEHVSTTFDKFLPVPTQNFVMQDPLYFLFPGTEESKWGEKLIKFAR